MSVAEALRGRVGLVFPGQGSQFVGMGKSLADTSGAARDVFAEADQILAVSLSGLCFEGPAAELDDTYNSQAAILTASVAALAAIRERLIVSGQAMAPVGFAGHSLGEFTALIAAGSLDFATTLPVVRERGRLMREAGQERPGGMAAVLGLDDDVLTDVCAEAAAGGILVIANANCPGQTVISGEIGPLERAMTLAKARGAKRVTRLGISIASHSPLMADASAQLAVKLAELPLLPPGTPIFANATGLPLTTVAEIRQELARHVERPVNWTSTIREMVKAGAVSFVEVGPGQILSGLIKRINRDVNTFGLGDFGLPVDKPVADRGN
ncbi:MAG: ACP S-malonyltransferase [Chloroflexota bacterium]|nr:ACP S-malonyltransferase [Pseudomonadota bacterium]MDQ3692303.1 ACP S-malonyltransferase [Chloroflexota bacterium]